MAERLLDDDPLAVREQPGLRETGDHDAEQRRRDLQIEHRVLRLAERARYPLVRSRVGEVAADVAEPAREPSEHLLVEVLAARDDRFARVVAQVIDAPVLGRHPDHRAFQQSAALEPVERAERHLLREVAGDPEDDEGVGVVAAHGCARYRSRRVNPIRRERADDRPGTRPPTDRAPSPPACEDPNGPRLISTPGEAGLVRRQRVQPRLIESLERQRERQIVRDRRDGMRIQRRPDRREQPGHEPGAEHHEHRDPVRDRRQQHRSEQRQRDEDHDPRHQREPGPTIRSGPRLPGELHDREHGAVQDQDVHRAHGGGAGEAAEQQLRAPERPHHQRLQQPSIGIAADRAERQEHGEHRAEEQRREHAQPDERDRHEPARVERPGVRARAERVDRVERLERREREQRQEQHAQHEHDEEHAPAHALLEHVPRDDERRRSPSGPSASLPSEPDTASR